MKVFCLGAASFCSPEAPGGLPPSASLLRRSHRPPGKPARQDLRRPVPSLLGGSHLVSGDTCASHTHTLHQWVGSYCLPHAAFSGQLALLRHWSTNRRWHTSSPPSGLGRSTLPGPPSREAGLESAAQLSPKEILLANITSENV